VRIERNDTGRRSLWPPFRRRRDLELTLALRTVDHLFTAPDLDPFSPDYETYGEKPGIEAIAAVLHAEQGVQEVETTLELPPDAIDPALERQVTEAIARYCRVKIAELDLDLLRLTRYGIRALAVGLVAVLALNVLSRPLDASNNPILELISQGLQIAAWVTLWFPINVLVYERWYSRRDRRVYTQMLLMDVTVAPNPSLHPVPAGRSTGR
jgi:hypothetical protein